MRRWSAGVVALFCAGALWAAAAAPNAKPRQRLSVLLVVLDTVRFDATSFGDPSNNNTPFLASLGSRSVVFTNAFSTHDFTPPSHFSMLTGFRDGLTSDDDRVENGVPWQLRQNGYATFAVVANGLLAPGQMPVMRGFDHTALYGPPVTSSLDYVNDVVEIDGRLGMFQCHATPQTRAKIFNSARRLLPAFIDEIRSARRPYFGFVNLVDAHEPYVPTPERHPPEARVPKGFDGDILHRHLPADLLRPETIADPARRQRIQSKLNQVKFPRLLSDDLSAEELAIYRNRYRAAINDLDENLREFFDRLQSEKLLDNTVVIITSDHGESFGEAGLVTHMLGDHGDYEATHHVPLIVVLPPSVRRKAAVVDRTVSIDMLAPTIYDLTGTDATAFRNAYAGYAPSLVTLITDPPAKAARATPPPRARQDHQQTAAERTKTLRSLGYIH